MQYYKLGLIIEDLQHYQDLYTLGPLHDTLAHSIFKTSPLIGKSIIL